MHISKILESLQVLEDFKIIFSKFFKTLLQLKSFLFKTRTKPLLIFKHFKKIIGDKLKEKYEECRQNYRENVYNFRKTSKKLK